MIIFKNLISLFLMLIFSLSNISYAKSDQVLNTQALNIQEANKQFVKYNIGMNPCRSEFIAYVNDIKAIGYAEKRGFCSFTNFMTVSGYLENGLNEISFDIAPSPDPENNKFHPESGIEFIVQKEIHDVVLDTPEVTQLSETSEDIELFKIIVTVDKNLTPTAKLLSEDEVELAIKVVKLENGFYRVSQTFEVDDLGEWAWTKAIPFEPTDENMQKLHKAYLEVWQTIENKDEDGFYDLSEASFREMEKAHFYPGDWYYTTDLDKYFEKSVGAYPINWDEYQLVSFNNGRLIKLENSKQRSPLGFKDREGELMSTYNPLFSLIDGEMIITR